MKERFMIVLYTGLLTMTYIALVFGPPAILIAFGIFLFKTW